MSDIKNKLPVVVLVGRPNVGKSTLFNRLVGKRVAIVHDEPGVTRDWKEGLSTRYYFDFVVVDTPGLSEVKGDSLSARMTRKAQDAIDNSDCIVFVTDGRAGLMPEDNIFAKIARKSGKPVVAAVNKCENFHATQQNASEFMRMGFGEPVLISAEHGMGIQDMIDKVEEHLKKAGYELAAATYEPEAQEEKDDGIDEIPSTIRLAILGRPNAGKSSLVNWIIGEERLLTGPEAGITRDSTTLEWSHNDHDFMLVDTAGLRRKSRIDEDLEKMSTSSSIRVLKECHVVVLVLDAVAALENQDLNIAELALKEGKALVIAINKMDLVKNRAEYLKAFQERIEKTLTQNKGIFCIPISVMKDKGKDRLFDAIIKTFQLWNTRLPTAALNRWLGQAEQSNSPPMIAGRRLRVKYISQVRVRPPTFVLFANLSDKIPDTYERYLINNMRETFNLPAIPIRLKLKSSANPYAEK